MIRIEGTVFFPCHIMVNIEKCLLGFFVLFVMSIPVLGQNTVGIADSLNNEAERYKLENPEKALSFAEKAQVVSQKENYLKGEIWALYHQSFYYSGLFENREALSKIDEALQLLKEDTLKLNRAALYVSKATILTRLGEVDEALFFISRAEADLDYCQEGNKKPLEYFLLLLKGRNYDRTGQMSLALKAYLDALKIAQKSNHKNDILNCYSNIAYVHKAMSNFEKAVQYYLKSLELSREAHDTLRIVINLSFIADTYLEEEKAFEAEPFLKEALQLSKKKTGDNRQELELVLYEFANYHRSLRKYEKAVEYALQSRKYSIEIQNYETLIANYTLVSNCFKNLKRYDEAIQEAKKGIHLAKMTHVDYHLIELYEIAAQAAESKGNTQQSYLFYKQYTLIKDSIFNEKKTQQIQELQTKYETKLKEQEIRDLEQAKQIEELEVATLKRKLLISGLLFFAFIVGSGWYVNRRRLHHRLEVQEKEQSKQESELKALRAQMNPHFIFNALNSIRDFIILSEKENADYYLGKFAVLMRGFLDTSSKEKVSLAEEIPLLHSYIELEGLRLGDGFQYEINFEGSFNEEEAEDIDIPPLLVQPYIENAFKHGLWHKKGKKRLRLIWSKVFREGVPYIQLNITDNGIGRKRSAEIKARKSKVYHSFATRATEERLALLKEQTNQNIEIKVKDLENEKQEPAGTQVQILIPVLILHHDL